MKLRYPLFLGSLILANPLLAEEEDEVRKKEIQKLTEITITAEPLAPSILEYTQPASVVEEKELRVLAEPSIGETVGLEPGVHSSYFGPGSSRPIIRGNGADRVRVIKNGIGSLDVSNTSEDHAVGVNPLLAESVEILRGPETLLYGSQAIGGAVNITDNSIPEENTGKPVSGMVDFRGRTGNDELTGGGVLEGSVGSFNYHLDGFYQDTGDIDIPGDAESARLQEMEEEEGEEHEQPSGVLANSATRTKGVTIGGSYVFDNGFVGVSVNGFDSNYGIPGHSHAHELGHDDHDEDHHDEHGMSHEEIFDHDDDQDDHGEGHEEILGHDDDHDEEHGEEHEHGEEEGGVRIDLEQVRFDTRGRFDDVSSSIESIKYNVGLSNYDHSEIEGGAVGTRFENDAVDARVEVLHAPLAGMDGVVGFQVQASDFNSEGEEAFLPQVDSFSPAIFLFEELELNENWKLQFGGRYEYAHYDAAGLSSDDFHPFSLSSGVVWDPTAENDYMVGLTFAYTQRAPSFTELYADGVHVARQAFEVGDQNLDKEQSWGFDLSFRKNTGMITGLLDVFVQDYDDYINLAGTGEEEDDLPVFNYENINAIFWGFETEVIFHLHEAIGFQEQELDFGVQVDYVRARNQSDSDDIPRIPPLRTIVGLEYGYKELGRARVEGVFVEEQDDVAEFELPTDSYQLLNAMVEVDIPVEEDFQIALFVRGTNLTDDEARVHSSFIKDLAPLRGRAFLFGTRTTF